jgi:hypothetical protein
MLKNHSLIFDQTANSLPLGSIKSNIRPSGKENIAFMIMPPASSIWVM